MRHKNEASAGQQARVETADLSAKTPAGAHQALQRLFFLLDVTSVASLGWAACAGGREPDPSANVVNTQITLNRLLKKRFSIIEHFISGH